jgi:hypothetical protein
MSEVGTYFTESLLQALNFVIFDLQQMREWVQLYG